MSNTAKPKCQRQSYNIEAINAAARGRWKDTLTAAGISADVLDGRGHPCPKCGGDDRFSAFNDFADRGAVICRKCFAKDNGDGIGTLMWFKGWQFAEAIEWLAEYLGLSPSTVSTSTKTHDSQEKEQFRRQTAKQPTGKTYPTARDAVAALDSLMHEKEHGQRVAQYTYHDINSEPVALVVRYDLPTPEGEKQKKTFRPVSKHANGWHCCDPPSDWPLYRLPELANASRVYVTEGEKAADAAREIGLTATTSAHGAGSPHLTDWSPLAGKERVISPDNDDDGAKYANKVAVILAKLTPPAVVRTLDLAGLPDHGDIADWIDSHEGDDAAELRRQLEALADQAEVLQPDRPTDQIERFRPFPTDALPDPVRGFVEAGAKAIGCDPSYLALPMLTMLASAIGNTRCIALKRGWTAPAIIWTAIVGDSGTAKTPAFKLAMKAIRNIQRDEFERHEEAMREYEVDLARHEKAHLAWRRDNNTDEPPPPKPEPPQATRLIVSDTTVEALAPILQANPRGVLLARDELAGWFGSFDRYAGGKSGADAAHWLSMHNGESIIVDRKTGTPRSIYVPQASVSVTGGIQPGILHRALGFEHRESGLAARLLLACPPRLTKRWTEADINPKVEAQIAALLDRLRQLQPAVDEQGNSAPIVVGLTADAKAAWILYYDAHAQEQVELAGELSAAWSKLEEYAARLALVVHYVRWAANDPTLQNPDVVDVTSITSGIKMVTWFKLEARRVYGLLSESDDDRDRRRLTEWIERKGGEVTAREVQQGNRKYRQVHDAEAALTELVNTGVGQWEPTPVGRRGRPTRRFVISTESSVYGNAFSTEVNTNSVDVDSVGTPETSSPDDDWGDL